MFHLKSGTKTRHRKRRDLLPIPLKPQASFVISNQLQVATADLVEVHTKSLMSEQSVPFKTPGRKCGVSAPIVCTLQTSASGGPPGALAAGQGCGW